MVVSLGVTTIALAAMVGGYILGATRAEWSAYSLAANSLVLQGIEQWRAAKFDVLTTPATDELVSSNFPPRTDLVLDIPQKGTNIACATNFTTITQISADPPLKMVRVDCLWPFKGRSKPAEFIELKSQYSGLRGSAATHSIIANASQPTTAGDGVAAGVRQQFQLATIPAFQFAIFYGVLMDIFPGPEFNGIGRVHSNDEYQRNQVRLLRRRCHQRSLRKLE